MNCPDCGAEKSVGADGFSWYCSKCGKWYVTKIDTDSVASRRLSKDVV